METFLFWVYALTACGGALAVVLSQNVVRMAFYLVISLGATAGLFFLLDADFVGATQILIYVGGTVVLLIFGVMLTSSTPFQSIKSSPAEILLGGVVGLAFLAVVMGSVLTVNWPQTQQRLAAGQPAATAARAGFNPEADGNTARPIGSALLGIRFDRDLRVNSEPSAQNTSALSTGYLLPFEIISVHLLVVLVGAAYLARAKRRGPVSQA